MILQQYHLAYSTELVFGFFTSRNSIQKTNMKKKIHAIETWILCSLNKRASVIKIEIITPCFILSSVYPDKNNTKKKNGKSNGKYDW